MDSTLPDAFEASQSGASLGQKAAGFDSQGRILSDVMPYVKVDGMFSIGCCGLGIERKTDGFSFRSAQI